MTHIAAIVLFAQLVSHAIGATPTEIAPNECDVLVDGPTPAGIAGAANAVKTGWTGTLVDPSDRIGGSATSGLSYSAFRSFESLNESQRMKEGCVAFSEFALVQSTVGTDIIGSGNVFENID